MRFVKIAYAFVRVAVTGQFVAASDDAAHQSWIALGHPTKREECCLGSLRCKHRKDAIDIGLYAALAPFPVAARNMRSKCRNMEVVFDVDRQGIRQRSLGSLA